MPVKLLKKKEIDALKQKERQAEIQEGIKLAKRVDSLRELAAQEEANLNKFRAKTVAEINKEITALAAKRDTLKKEIDDLLRERKVGMAEVEREYNAVQKLAVGLKEEAVELQNRADRIAELEKLVEKKLAQATEQKLQHYRQMRRANLTVKNTEAMHEEALKEYARAASRRLQTEKLREQASKQIAAQRNELFDRARSLDVREAELLRRATELDKRELYINDKYQTFEKITRHYETKRSSDSKK